MHLKSTDVDRNGQPSPAQRFLGLAAASLVIVPPASADDATIWSATLSVKILTLNNNIFGCSNDYPFNARCSNSNVLSDDDFSLHGTTYEITKMEDDDSGTSRELKLTLNSALPANVLGILTLNVGNTALAFEDASVSSNSKRFTWPSSFSWSSGNNVALSITGPAVTGTLETFHTLEKRSGRFSYRFDLKLSEPIWIPFRDMRDHAFDVTNGTVVKAKRIDKSRRLHNGRWRTFSNHWRMTVNPADEDDVVSVSLSSKPCSERGALCTADGGGLLEKEVTFDFPAFKDLGVSIADAKGDEDDGRITFEVTLSRSSDFYVEVDWKTTTEGTATEGTDFRKRKGMIVFVPGTTTEQLQVGLIDDDFETTVRRWSSSSPRRGWSIRSARRTMSAWSPLRTTRQRARSTTPTPCREHCWRGLGGRRRCRWWSRWRSGWRRRGNRASRAGSRAGSCGAAWSATSRSTSCGISTGLPAPVPVGTASPMGRAAGPTAGSAAADSCG